ncbi:CocE/NonD family hydrolase [Pseudomonas sp.]|uniref:CocE/NonD family hydrolase n=1 Tax=Pseudomonas sp. TaxID=306 RepID=UPI003D0B873B
MSSPFGRMVVELGVTMKMRDGVEIVADVYRPAQGQWPAVLARCPYDRQDPAVGSMVIMDPAWLARQGYAVIVQDTRGRGESGGAFDPVYQEVEDGYDSVEWAAAQPWCSGEVGIYGSSYLGIATYQAAGAKPPHLKAAVAFVGGTRPMGRHLNGNVFDATFVTWYAYLTTLMTVMRADIEDARKQDLVGRILTALADPVATASCLPLDKLDVISDPELAPFWFECLQEPNTSEDARVPLLADHNDIGEVALLHIAGYRDFLSADGFALAQALADNPRHRFIAGPFTHRGVYSGFTGSRELPGTSTPAGPLGWGPIIAAWFDIHLKGGTGATHPIGLPWLIGPSVRYYLEGENRWEGTESWPPATSATEWLLSSQGNARSSSGDGRLMQPGQAGSDEATVTFVADPHAPFPSCGGAMGIPEQGPEGIQDQRLVDHRDDVLVFTSDILDAPVTIAGKQELRLRFSSSAPDADICVTLVDVEPNGFAYNVAEGFQRTRYRNGGTSDWLSEGEPVELAVQTHDTAYVFKPGHRIRVMVAGACYPRVSRNLHTTTRPELGTMEEAVAATHRVHLGGMGSRLVLNRLA